MGICRFCGENAGWFRHYHPDCKQHTNQSRTDIEKIIASFSSKSPHITNLAETVATMADEGKLTGAIRTGTVMFGLKKFLNGAMDISLPPESVITEMRRMVKQETKIAKVGLFFEPIVSNLDKIYYLTLVANKHTSRLNTKVPTGMNIGRDETPIWTFWNAELYEDRTQTRRVGGGQGVSLRVTKGVYYHVGKFKTQNRTSVEHVHVDTGNLLITNKNIYFVGSTKAVKLPFPKIISVTPYSDGIMVLKDGATAKPAYFVTGDTWFATNMLSLAMQT